MTLRAVDASAAAAVAMLNAAAAAVLAATPCRLFQMEINRCRSDTVTSRSCIPSVAGSLESGGSWMGGRASDRRASGITLAFSPGRVEKRSVKLHIITAATLLFGNAAVLGQMVLPSPKTLAPVQAAAPLFAPAMRDFPAVVVGISDGDTVTAVVDLGFGVSITNRVRFASINAPELKTSAGLASRDWLAGQLGNLPTAVTLRTVSSRPFDDYGRILGAVLLGGQDLGAGSVQAGHATPWPLPKKEGGAK